MRPGSAGRALLRLASPAGARARLLIFTFHRVLAQPDPLLPDEPDISRFALMAGWIARYCNAVPLPEAVERLAAGRLPARAACITFDDGYADTEANAWPVLREHGLPATVYVAVDAVRNGIMWNDLALDAVRSGGGELDVSCAGLPQASWRSWPDAARAAQLLSALKYRPRADRWRLASELHERATGGKPPRRHMLTPGALRRIARAGFDIGGHTVTHPILAQLPDAEARQEILACREWIATEIGTRAVSFAYPNGKPGRDFDERHAAMARAAGFRSAVSTQWGAAARSADPYALPRVAPWASSRNRFLATLVRSCL